MLSTSIVQCSYSVYKVTNQRDTGPEINKSWKIVFMLNLVEHKNYYWMYAINIAKLLLIFLVRKIITKKIVDHTCIILSCVPL